MTVFVAEKNIVHGLEMSRMTKEGGSLTEGQVCFFSLLLQDGRVNDQILCDLGISVLHHSGSL